jgi:hypothetical protein
MCITVICAVNVVSVYSAESLWVEKSPLLATCAGLGVAVTNEIYTPLEAGVHVQPTRALKNTSLQIVHGL